MPENVDLTELEKFSQGDWWNTENGDYVLLHQLNPLRLEFVRSYLNLTGKKFIDLGCGGGIFSEALAKAGAIVTGVDLNKNALEQAKLHAVQSNLIIDYQCANIETFSAQHAGEFDALSCMELLEHVPDPESILAASAQLVRSGSLLFFSTINRSFLAYLKTILCAEYIFNLLPKGTHEYQKFIKPSELCGMARKYGLKLVDLKGFNYSPWKKNFLFTQELDANYLAVFEA